MKTDNTQKHTPTPWKAIKNKIMSDRAFIATVLIQNFDLNFDGTAKNDPEMEANAAFIVKACNEYESLTDKVRELNDLNADQYTQITNLKNTNQKLLEALQKSKSELESLVDAEDPESTTYQTLRIINETLKASE